MHSKRKEPNHSELLKGNALYIQRARVTLPWLVWQAKSGRTIFYSDLAKKIKIANPRNLNYILGAIGKALNELGVDTCRDIPPIQCIVVNKQNQLPGAGIGWLNINKSFNSLSNAEKQATLSIYLAQIFTYPHWDWVLNELGLKPVLNVIEREMELAKRHIGGGESDQHRNLKEYIAENPAVVGLDSDTPKGEVEYPLPSCDAIDVLFTQGTLKVGVEVKSSISETADILRGLFQCVKYRALIEAQQLVFGENRNCNVVFALEGKLPKKLEKVRDQLDVKVIDNIKVPRNWQN